MQLLTKIVITIILIIGFVYYVPEKMDSYSTRQFKYNQWLSSILKSKTLPNSQVTLTLTNKLTDHSVRISVANDRYNQLTRILRLLPETGLFSQSNTDTKNQTFTLLIKDNKKSFHLAFSEEYLVQNIRLQNLITLLQMYGADNS